MWCRRRKITPAAASAAKATLQDFCAKIDALRQLDETLKHNPHYFSDQEQRRLAAAQADAQKAHGPLSDALLHQTAEVGLLIRSVHIDGFDERAPRYGRERAQRAIGIYGGIESGGDPPDPPAPEASDQTGASSDRGSWWVTALIALASGGAATAGVNAYWGTAVRCEPNQEFVCPLLNGVEYGQRCNISGVGRTRCLPLSKLRETELPAPPTSP